MKILGIGESVIDNVYTIKNHRYDLKPDNNAKSQHIGGPVLSALILLSRLNIDCTFLTSIGIDDAAELIKKKLNEENVIVIAHVEKRTKTNTILINSKNGQREKIRGTIKHSFINNISTQFIQQFDLIIIDRHERDAFYEIIRKKKCTTKIIIDPSTEVSDFTFDMIRYAEYPILPIEYLVKIGKGKKLIPCLKIIYQICDKPCMITAGPLGSLIYDGKKLKLIPAVEIKTVDTTGAGDIYRGAFAYGVVQKWSLDECARFANTVAALQCTKLGNVTAIPTKKEINLFTGFCTRRKFINISTVNNYFLSLQ